MNRFRMVVVVAAAVWLVSAASATAWQRAREDAFSPAPPDWGARMGRIPGGELQAIKTLRKAVRKELDLSDQQAKRIDGLFDEQVEKVKEILREQRERRRQDAGKVAEISRALAEAARERDRDRMNELREQLRDLRSSDRELREARQEFEEALAAEVDEGQREKLRRLIAANWLESISRRFGLHGFATMWRILREMDLGSEQRRSVLQVRTEFARELREARDEPERTADIESKMREKILELLDEEQKARFLDLEKERAERDKERLSRDRRPRPQTLPDGRGSDHRPEEGDHDDDDHDDDDHDDDDHDDDDR